jgi:hypothetical protein
LPDFTGIFRNGLTDKEKNTMAKIFIICAVLSDFSSFCELNLRGFYQKSPIV